MAQARKYGWIPDLPDHRDHLFAVPPELLRALPPRADLRAECPAVYDQGDLGSCTANAIAGVVQFDLERQHARDPFTPSRLFIYYNERVMEGTVGEDAGATLRDGIKSVAKLGAAHESLWPYIPERFATRPPTSAYTDAEHHQAIAYQRLPRALASLKACLASGYPFVFGFSVYESFESATVARTGTVPMPLRHERLLGGHAVAAVGYDDTEGRFIVRNSWGERWGDRGYCTMPYEYLLDDNLADDFWTVRQMEDGEA